MAIKKGYGTIKVEFNTAVVALMAVFFILGAMVFVKDANVTGLVTSCPPTPEHKTYYIHTFETVTEGQVINLQPPCDSPVPFTNVQMTALRNLIGVRFRIESGTAFPPDYPELYSQYMYARANLTNISNTFIDNIVIDFRVPVEWLRDNNVPSRTVKLFKFSNSQWVELPTKYTSSDEEYVYYESVSDIFSDFAIAQKQPYNPVPAPEIETPAADDTAAQPTEAPPEQGTSDSTMLLTAAVIFAFTCILLLAVFLRRVYHAATKLDKKKR